MTISQCTTEGYNVFIPSCSVRQLRLGGGLLRNVHAHQVLWGCWRDNSICSSQAAFSCFYCCYCFSVYAACIHPDFFLFFRPLISFRSPVLLRHWSLAVWFHPLKLTSSLLLALGVTTLSSRVAQLQEWIPTVFLGKASLAGLYIEYSVNGALWIWATLHHYGHCT